MNKADIVSLVAAEPSVNAAAAERMAATVFAVTGDALAQGEPVAIAGFGKFATRSRAARQRRNPRTGESVAIAGHAWIMLSRGVERLLPMQSHMAALHETCPNIALSGRITC